MKKVTLKPATEKDAQLIHQMQCEAFLPLYEKYHDDETSPAKESIERVKGRITNLNSEYYLIQVDGENAGAIRAARKVVKKGEEKIIIQNVQYISPLFILPAFQNRGIAQEAMKQVFELYPDTITWKLDTIKQEAGNCHLYEKCGFVRIGKEHVVNENMTLVDYEKTNVTVRRFEEKDAEAVSNLICRNFLEVNSKDYGLKAMEKLAQSYDAAKVKQVASFAHMYVFEWQSKIVGVGAISSFWGSKKESILLTIFVLPEHHGKGIGRTIINTLEQDAFFTRAERVEIPASITATEFYRKFGYNFKNGVKELDDEGHYRLEKLRDVQSGEGSLTILHNKSKK